MVMGFQGRAFNLQKALLLSVVLHGVLLSIHFAKPNTDKPFRAPLEVILVNAKSAKAPEQAQAMAQVALDGGGQADQGRATTLPSEAEDEVIQRELMARQKQLQALEHLQRELTGGGLRYSPHDPALGHVEGKSATESTDSRNGQDDKSQRALEMKRLQAQIADNIKSYNERPRKHFFSPRTSPYLFAMYEEAWRHKVESVGNTHYPDELKGKIYGKLRLTAYIKADGSLEEVEIDRSSGSTVLDRAAVRILRQSAPFPPFSSDMRQKIDVLAITRTWVFSRDEIRTE
ncbi:TonB family protein [Limnobacter humi]|uniref:TonB family protein n=1 Tax=Limnobacter humi TaxID=1778671 RepID=A0ABT1WHK3_9BURK|nr:TonB family protein [Limnobacter humi]MCQ8897000.1 TonB family protein [Limnobacter humi]